MSKCIYPNCPFEADRGNEYCFWHKKVDGKKITDEKLKELKEVIKSGHMKALENGYFKGADLTRLSEVNSLDFLGCDFENANFSHSNISVANFMHCLFENTMFENTIAIYTSFRACKIIDSNFHAADLSISNFSSLSPPQSLSSKGSRRGYVTEIIGSVFDQATMNGANLEEIFITECLFRLTDMESTNFANAALSKNYFEGSTLTGSNFWGVMLKENKFYDCDFRYSNFLGWKENIPIKDNIFKARDIHDIIGELLHVKQFIKEFDIVLIDSLPVDIQLDLLKKGFVRYIKDPESSELMVFYIDDIDILLKISTGNVTNQELINKAGIYTTILKKITFIEFFKEMKKNCDGWFSERTFLNNFKTYIKRNINNIARCSEGIFVIKLNFIFDDIPEKYKRFLDVNKFILKANKRNNNEKGLSRGVMDGRSNIFVKIAFLHKKDKKFVKNPLQDIGLLESDERLLENELYCKKEFDSFYKFILDKGKIRMTKEGVKGV